MLIAIIAIALIFGVVIVLTLQPTIFDLLTSKSEGMSRRARLRTAFVVLIVSGGAIVMIGEFATLRPIRDLGVAKFLASIPILIVRIVDARNGSRRNTKT
jgi:hypothetical protein